MSDNSSSRSDESNQTKSEKELLFRELKKRTSLDRKQIHKMISCRYNTKYSKHLDLLVGDVDRYNYGTQRIARMACQEEFMWLADGDLDVAMEMLTASETVGDHDEEALRQETKFRFIESGRSIRTDPTTWKSTDSE